jgi:hypothetical protein
VVYRWATGWMIEGFESRQGMGIFLFTTASRPASGPTQAPIQWVPGALSLGVKWPGSEADHSLPSSAEVEEWVELYLHSPNTPLWRGARLKKSAGTILAVLLLIKYEFTATNISGTCCVASPVGLFLCGDQVDVISDEKLPDTNHSGAPLRHKLAGAEIRFPSLIFQLRTERVHLWI